MNSVFLHIPRDCRDFTRNISDPRLPLPLRLASMRLGKTKTVALAKASYLLFKAQQSKHAAVAPHLDYFPSY